MRSWLLAVAISTMPVLAAPVSGAELEIKSGQSLPSVLEGHVGTRVTLLLDSGSEVTGTLKAVLPNVLQLHAIAGKEFFDAVIAIDKIEGVLIRTTDD